MLTASNHGGLKEWIKGKVIAPSIRAVIVPHNLQDLDIRLPPEVALKRMGVKLPRPGQVDTSGPACDDYIRLPH